MCLAMKAAFAVGGLNRVRVTGVKQARVTEAPVLCIAPHSTFFDAIALVYLNAPSVVAKADAANLPIFGSMHTTIVTFLLQRRSLSSIIDSLLF